MIGKSRASVDEEKSEVHEPEDPVPHPGPGETFGESKSVVAELDDDVTKH